LRAVFHVAPAHSATEPEWLGDDFKCRHSRIERGSRILKDELNVRPNDSQLALAEECYVCSFEKYPSGSRPFQTREAKRQRAFPGAGFAHQRQRQTVPNGNRDVVKRDKLPAFRKAPAKGMAHGHAARFQQWLCGFHLFGAIIGCT
jgi:hypothetical protein